MKPCASPPFRLFPGCVMTSTRTWGELQGSVQPAWTISVESDGFPPSSHSRGLNAGIGLPTLKRTVEFTSFRSGTRTRPRRGIRWSCDWNPEWPVWTFTPKERQWRPHLQWRDVRFPTLWDAFAVPRVVCLRDLFRIDISNFGPSNKVETALKSK